MALTLESVSLLLLRASSSRLTDSPEVLTLYGLWFAGKEEWAKDMGQEVTILSFVNYDLAWKTTLPVVRQSVVLSRLSPATKKKLVAMLDDVEKGKVDKDQAEKIIRAWPSNGAYKAVQSILRIILHPMHNNSNLGLAYKVAIEELQASDNADKAGKHLEYIAGIRPSEDDWLNALLRVMA